jgi:hypothetical protein
MVASFLRISSHPEGMLSPNPSSRDPVGAPCLRTFYETITILTFYGFIKIEGNPVLPDSDFLQVRKNNPFIAAAETFFLQRRTADRAESGLEK